MSLPALKGTACRYARPRLSVTAEAASVETVSTPEIGWR
jgi:hypothetical protein